MTKGYTVEEASAKLGVTARTLHYYEEIGLIREVPRREGGHRIYDEAAIARIAHILRLKTLLGISLQDIRPILEAEEELAALKLQYHAPDVQGNRGPILERGIQLLESVVGSIDEKIGKLQSLRTAFAERLERVNRIRQTPEGGNGKGEEYGNEEQRNRGQR